MYRSLILARARFACSFLVKTSVLFYPMEQVYDRKAFHSKIVCS